MLFNFSSNFLFSSAASMSLRQLWDFLVANFLLLNIWMSRGEWMNKNIEYEWIFQANLPYSALNNRTKLEGKKKSSMFYIHVQPQKRDLHEFKIWNQSLNCNFTFPSTLVKYIVSLRLVWSCNKTTLPEQIVCNTFWGAFISWILYPGILWWLVPKEDIRELSSG